jgi:hypothetical protein
MQLTAHTINTLVFKQYIFCDLVKAALILAYEIVVFTYPFYMCCVNYGNLKLKITNQSRAIQHNVYLKL